MKLLKDFKKCINELGPIKRAWFTTFNLSPSFVERFILQVLTGSIDKLTTIADFEAVQDRINRSDMDIHFFFDHRMLDLRDVKKTSVPFHSIRPGDINERCKGGAFHPKVILLQNNASETMVIASSANLTISGWGRNREAVVYRKVKDAANAGKLTDFFKQIHKAAQTPFPKNFIIKTSKAVTKEWEFISSFVTDNNFISKISTGNDNKLYVWSPYLTPDMADFKDKFINPILGNNTNLTIIPDPHPGKLRIKEDPEVIKKLDKRLDIKFLFDNDDRKNEKINITHAKVWATTSIVAIGSWNCTEAGIGKAENHNNNIEAGIVFKNPSHSLPSINGDEIKTLYGKCMTQEELEQEKDEGSESLPFFISVSYDWSSYFYYIRVKPDNKEKNLFNQAYKLKVPGIEDKIILNKDFIEKPAFSLNRLVENRVFSIITPTGDTYTGFIIELNYKKRPSYKFDTLSETIDFWIGGSAEPKPAAKGEELEDKEKARINNDTDSQEYLPVPESTHVISYFQLFKAFKNFLNKIEGIQNNNEIKKVDIKISEMHSIISTMPGNLGQLSQQIKVFCKEEKKVSFIYKWFLVEELNYLLKMCIDGLHKLGDHSKDEYLKSLMVSNHFDKMFNSDKQKKYIDYICKSCNYHEVL